jgi:VWFA-related protein
MNMKLLALLLVASMAGWSQSKEPVKIDEDPVIKVDVDLVSVLANVRAKNGALVGGLTKDDFRIFEDGKQQEIKYFTRETDLPLTIGLLVDVSGSQERLIEVERRAAEAFFKSVLRPKDLAFLISFGHEAELLQDATSSIKLLRDGLSQLKLNTAVGGLHPGPVPTANSGAGTILWDAVYLAAEDRLKGEAGRKVIVVITDGVDTGSQKSRTQAIEAAQKADAIVYSIYYADFAMGGGGGQGDLRRMSDDTGGRVFDIDRRTTLEDAFHQIQEEMRSQYSISYSPTNPKKDGTFRKLELKTVSKDQKVQARRGYYAIESQQ